MSYVTQSQLTAAVPADLAAELLTDDAWVQIETAVETEINGKLAQRYPLPLAEPVPAIIQNAALVLAAESLYQRKGYYGDANPWTKRADGIRGTQGQQGGQPGLLDKIAAGETPLYAKAKSAASTASAITEPAITTSRTGARLC